MHNHFVRTNGGDNHGVSEVRPHSYVLCILKGCNGEVKVGLIIKMEKGSSSRAETYNWKTRTAGLYYCDYLK